MRITDIIRKKRDGYALSEEEINFFVDGYVNGEIPDYQISALLMAIYFNDMNDEEIDMLIDTMDSIIDTYEEYLTAINDIRDTENAAILTPINISLINDTNLTFVGLSLHQKGTIENVDLLETLSGFMPAQRMAGLVIYRDVQNTPWVLELVSEDGSLYELNLSVKDYSEDGCVLTLTYDSEKDAILIG